MHFWLWYSLRQHGMHDQGGALWRCKDAARCIPVTPLCRGQAGMRDAHRVIAYSYH